MTFKATSEVMNCIACDREVRMTFTRSDNPNVPDMVLLDDPGTWMGIVRDAEKDNVPTIIVACSALCCAKVVSIPNDPNEDID